MSRHQLVTAAAVLTLLSGCATSHGDPAAPGPVAHVGVVATDKGWDPTSLHGPIPKSGSCHYRHTNGYLLPDPRCTPGAIDTGATDANVHQTVCRKGGYTASVRPPRALTEPV